ncbi:hypothetical protein PSYAR_13084 [Pseudomonas syringae pv. aceris str. M302273]|nr:hypothetical protein PSYAR_13084 [Pseudomonas syringae pv. aceris str. M302273]
MPDHGQSDALFLGEHHHGVELVGGAVLLSQLTPALPQRMFLGFG